MASLFQLPDELLLAPLLQSFPCRERQIRALATLLHPDAAPCRNLVLHGAEATGKTGITESLLPRLARSAAPNLRYAIVSAARCVTARHLFETVVGAVADALRRGDDDGDGLEELARRRCETLAQLAVEMDRMLGAHTKNPRRRFVLVLDAVDRQRDAPPTLLPALARLSETIPSLTCVFIVTAPPAGSLRTTAAAYLHFPPYAKQDFVRILALHPPAPLEGATQQETSDLWARFCAAVHDALARPAARTLPAFRHGCLALWPRFTAPVVAGTHAPREFSKLLVAARGHFQDESLLDPGVVSVLRPGSGAATAPDRGAAKQPPPATADLSTLLPTTARLLLLCAYLASHNATRHDLTLFSTYHHGRKRRRGGGGGGGGISRSKHRKIARKLLGAHAFVLERMTAIFAAVRTEWLLAAQQSSSSGTGSTAVGGAGLDGDVGMALATLASLRLLHRVGGAGGGDVMDRGGKWRINVGWEVVRGVGRSIGVEVEEWLID